MYDSGETKNLKDFETAIEILQKNNLPFEIDVEHAVWVTDKDGLKARNLLRETVGVFGSL